MFDIAVSHELGEKASEQPVIIRASGQMWLKDLKVLTYLDDSKAAFGNTIEDRLLPEKNSPVGGTPCKQVLWTLMDEVPSKMTEADQIQCIRIAYVGALIISGALPVGS